MIVPDGNILMMGVKKLDKNCKPPSLSLVSYGDGSQVKAPVAEKGRFIHVLDFGRDQGLKINMWF